MVPYVVFPCECHAENVYETIGRLFTDGVRVNSALSFFFCYRREPAQVQMRFVRKGGHEGAAPASLSAAGHRPRRFAALLSPWICVNPT